ncbi:hypothetical protein V8C43DRAFT_291403 [Trichoderma afarasin]
MDNTVFSQSTNTHFVDEHLDTHAWDDRDFISEQGHMNVPSLLGSQSRLEIGNALVCPRMYSSEPLDMPSANSLGLTNRSRLSENPSLLLDPAAISFGLLSQITEVIDSAPGSTGSDSTGLWIGDVSATSSPQPSLEATTDDWFPADVYEMGFPNDNGTWSCKYAGCTSQVVFERACDLRKHYKSHVKVFFCNQPECMTSGAGFASKKDFDRHTRSHQPNIPCIVPSCNRVFSRLDNMRNHFIKMHLQRQNTMFPRPCRRRSSRFPRKKDSDTKDHRLPDYA